MLTVLWATSLLVGPTLYLMGMLVAWACVRQRGPRIAIVSAMALVPLGMAGHAAWQAWSVVQAEKSFSELCRAAPPPVVHARAADVESILINVRTAASNAADVRHPQLVFPMEVASRFLLQGAVRYPRLERIASWGPYQTVDPRNSGRPTEAKSATSRYAVEWRSLESRSEFVTTGILVVMDSAEGRVLAEQRTHYFGSRPVTLLGAADLGLYVVRAKSIACPTTRQLVHFVKSVARPAAAPGS